MAKHTSQGFYNKISEHGAKTEAQKSSVKTFKITFGYIYTRNINTKESRDIVGGTKNNQIQCLVRKSDIIINFQNMIHCVPFRYSGENYYFGIIHVMIFKNEETDKNLAKSTDEEINGLCKVGEIFFKKYPNCD